MPRWCLGPGQVLPHVDAAYLPTVAYTALLYLAAPAAGGETLLIDSLDSQGVFSRGTMVAPQRNRVLFYSAGPENVHTAAGNLRGERIVLQFWCRLDV